MSKRATSDSRVGAQTSLGHDWARGELTPGELARKEHMLRYSALSSLHALLILSGVCVCVGGGHYAVHQITVSLRGSAVRSSRRFLVVYAERKRFPSLAIRNLHICAISWSWRRCKTMTGCTYIHLCYLAFITAYLIDLSVSIECEAVLLKRKTLTLFIAAFLQRVE